jgi:glycosyltransferase involved in cell wall biosynthesis
MKGKLSALITSYNEEENIRECLESVAFADEILLVDSFSTDRTVEIAKSIPGVRVLQREYFSAAAQKNWALGELAHPWVLIVDCDERVTPELAREITGLLEKGPGADHYSLRRKAIVFGRTIRYSGVGTDTVVRFFRRGSVRYPERQVHADIHPEGPTPTLRFPMLHYLFRSFDHYVARLHRYARWGAADLFRRGRRAGPIELFLRPAWRFLRMYVVQAGFLDGYAGFVLCALQSYGAFLKWGKLWEWRERERKGLPVELPAFDKPASA